MQKILDKIFNLNNISVSEIAEWVTQGPNPIFSTVGMPCLTGRNISKGEVVFQNSDLVSEEEYEKLKRFKILEGDILMTLKGFGSTGKVALYTSEKKAIFSRNLGLIRLKDQEVTKELLFAFLASRLGQKIIDRGVTGGTGQLTLPTAYLKKLKIPKFGRSFISAITHLVIQSQNKYRDSNLFYSQAEQILLQEIGFENFQSEEKNSYIINLSEVQESNRMDAEYFQPKYEEIIEKIKKYRGGYDRLENLVRVKDEDFIPEDNERYRYIELANISANGEVFGFTENLGRELPLRARRQLQKGDLIISSIEGSLESIALITEDWKNVLCSTGFFTVSPEKINVETLLVFLKTTIGQLQLKKGCRGTILTAINRDELSKIILPRIDSESQKKVKVKVSEMYKTKKLSKRLLEIAKRGVEMAIEKNEKEAEKWIHQELARLDIKL